MAFDIYLAGGYSPAEDYIFGIGANRLFSQVNDRNGIRKWCDKLEAAKTANKIFIDSGAYTVYTKQKELDVDEYISYINGIDEDIAIAAQVDKIPGVWGQPKTVEQILEAPAQSWENYLYMRERVKSPDKLIPIFHRREDFKWLDLMLETTFDGKHIPYIGIAATTDSTVKEKRDWFEKVFKHIRHSSNPNVKTHAFGMTSLTLLELYPFTSADSTSWLMTAINGGIQSPFGVIYVSEKNKHEAGHILGLSSEIRKAVEDYVTQRGFTLEELSTEYAARERINALYFVEWSQTYEYKGTGFYRRSLF